MKNQIIFISAILLGLFLIGSVSAVTIYKDTPDYGLVKITIEKPSFWSSLSNLFTAYFQTTQVYTGEEVSIQDSYTFLASSCPTIAYWEIFIKKGSGSFSGLGDVSDYANNVGGCNFEVWVSFVTNDVGTYSLQSKIQKAGGTVSTMSGGNTLSVIAQTGTQCEWQPWALHNQIPHGMIRWREYKDLNLGDNNPCTDHTSEYETDCDTGYHVQGEANGVRQADGISQCISDTVSQTCSQLGGHICVDTSQCSGAQFLQASDTSLCCQVPCQGGGSTCKTTGESCTSITQCCSGFSCTSGTCQISSSVLKNNGESCTQNVECKSSFCLGGVCATYNPGSSSKKTSLTYTQLYSLSDAQSLLDNNICTDDSQCLAKEGYNVSCKKQSSSFNSNLIITQARTSWCAVPGGIIGWTLDIGELIISGSNFCTGVTNQVAWIKSLFPSSNPGICIAESNTWYGSIWDKYLNIIAGFGMKYNYVLLVAIGGILIVLVLLKSVMG